MLSNEPVEVQKLHGERGASVGEIQPIFLDFLVRSMRPARIRRPPPSGSIHAPSNAIPARAGPRYLRFAAWRSRARRSAVRPFAAAVAAFFARGPLLGRHGPTRAYALGGTRGAGKLGL